MTIAFTSAHTNTQNAGGAVSTDDSTSWTPDADSMYLASVVVTGGGFGETAGTLTGNGITWTSLYRCSLMQLWRGVAGGSPSAGALTYTADGVETFQYSSFAVTKVTGVALTNNGADAVVQVFGLAVKDNDGNNTTTVTITSANSANALYAAFGAFGGAYTGTERANWTELAPEITISGQCGHQRQYRVSGGDTAASVTWSSTPEAYAMGVELVAPVTANADNHASARGFARGLTRGFAG